MYSDVFYIIALFSSHPPISAVSIMLIEKVANTEKSGIIFAVHFAA